MINIYRVDIDEFLNLSRNNSSMYGEDYQKRPICCYRSTMEKVSYASIYLTYHWRMVIGSQSTIYYFPQNSNRKVNSILLYKENSRIWYYTLERHYDFVILSSRIPRASPSHRNTFSLFKIPKRKEEKYRIDMSQWTDLDLLRRTRHHLLVTDDISPTTWNLKLAKYKSNNRWKLGAVVQIIHRFKHARNRNYFRFMYI